MPDFTYTARTKSGETVTDVVSAPSKQAAGSALRSKGLLPTSIREKRGNYLNWDSLTKVFAHVSLLEKLTFVKNLAVTIKAGLPVSRALNVLSKQMPNPYFRTVVEDIAHQVESGTTLSESMAKYGNVFSPIFVNMVKVGESTGELDNALEYLARQVGRDFNLIRRTRGALIYPAVVLFALVIIGYLMFTFVLPRLIGTFKEFNAELPLLTKIIIKVVDIFSQYSILVALFFLIAGLTVWLWRKTESGRAFFHRLNLVLPVVGKMVKKLNSARFTIIFGGLLRSGMPIVEALRVTSNTMTNVYYQQALADASEKVKIGIDLVAVLEKYPKLFAPMVTQMIRVGEETGTMEKILEEVANFYEADIDETVKNLSSIIEPVLVIVIGAIVGLLAVGLILPIYNITQSL